MKTNLCFRQIPLVMPWMMDWRMSGVRRAVIGPKQIQKKNGKSLTKVSAHENKEMWQGEREVGRGMDVGTLQEIEATQSGAD